MPPARPRHRFPRNAFDWSWLCFVIWTAVGFVVMPLGITAEQAHAWFDQYGAGDFAAALLRVSDAIWMLLAAITVYLHAVASEGLSTARRQAAIILVASTAFEWAGTRTGFPFGPYEYTENFGPRIGGVVPIAIPLAWLVVIFCARNLALWIRPHAGRLEIAVGVAVTAVLTDLNLESVAWHIRNYWVWYPARHLHPPASWPPFQNYVAWFALAFALALILPTDHVLRIHRPSRLRPVLILVLLNALLALVHLTGSWRSPPDPANERTTLVRPQPCHYGCSSTTGAAAAGAIATCRTASNCWSNPQV